MARALETWVHQNGEGERLRRAATKVIARMEKNAAWVAYHTWASNVGEVKRMALIGGQVVRRWMLQTIAHAFLMWEGKAAEESRMRQILDRVRTRWTKGCLVKSMSRWMEAADRNQPISVGVLLDAEFEQSVGSKESKASFENQLTDDICSALQVEMGRVTILCHQKGSVVSEIVFGKPDAQAVAEQFVEFVENREGILVDTALGKQMRKAKVHGPVCEEVIKALAAAKAATAQRMKVMNLTAEVREEEHRYALLKRVMMRMRMRFLTMCFHKWAAAMNRAASLQVKSHKMVARWAGMNKSVCFTVWKESSDYTWKLADAAKCTDLYVRR